MTLATAMTVALLLPTISDNPERPPQLTFEKHVDYAAWVNDLVSRGKAELSPDPYEGLYPGSPSGGMPGFEGVVREQFDKYHYRVWKAEDYPELAAYIKTCSPYLDILDQAVKRKDFWLPVRKGWTGTMPHPIFLGTGRASRALIARAWMKQDQQANALTHAHKNVLRLAEHLQQTGQLIGNMVGIIARPMVYDSLASALEHGIIKPENAASVYRRIHKYDPRSPDWDLIIQVEWAYQLDVLQNMCPDGKYNAEHWKGMAETDLVDDGARIAKLAATSDPREATAALDQHFTDLRQAVAGSPRLRKSTELSRIAKDAKQRYQVNVYVEMLLSDLSGSYERAVMTESHRRGTLLTLALHAHYAKHGKWPESLKKIDKKLGFKALKTLRRDPFTGKSFKYELKDGQPLLYSVGYDGKDDGGRHDPKWGESDNGGDFVFWPYQRP